MSLLLQVQYVVTGFIQHIPGIPPGLPGERDPHYEAFVSHGDRWWHCNDRVVKEVSKSANYIWPCMVFMEKIVRQRGKADGGALEKPSETDMDSVFQVLPALLAQALGARKCGLGKFARGVRAARQQKKMNMSQARGRKRQREGRVDGTSAKRRKRQDTRRREGRQQDRAGRRQDRADQHQDRAGRRQDRADRRQERQETRKNKADPRLEREARERQEETFGGKSWSSNLDGARRDGVNEADNPFTRYEESRPLRRVRDAETLRMWSLQPEPLPPQPCLLCEAAFDVREDLLVHVNEEHGGLQRYRNAVMHLESLCPHVVAGAEVLIVLFSMVTLFIILFLGRAALLFVWFHKLFLYMT